MRSYLRLTAGAALLITAVLSSSCAGSSHPQSTAGTPNQNIKADDAYYNMGASPQGVSIPRQTYDRSPN